MLSFFSSLFGSKKPRLTDLTLNTEGWELHHQNEASIAWFAPQREAVRIQLFPACEWPFSLSDVEAAKEYWQRETERLSGALIDIETLNIQKVPALRAIFKYRDPTPGSLGIYYVGIIWLPFKDALFQINVEDVERGTTGVREAIVANLLLHKGEIEVSEEEPEMLNSGEELFARLRESKLHRIPSDDRQYDEALPEHPLSRVRKLLDFCASEIQLSRSLQKTTPLSG